MDKIVGTVSPNKSPLISVVLPVYNAALYLDEAIQSILNQTLSDFELLIFNDASSDSSDEIIRSYQDCRIVYEKMVLHTGYVVLLNKGLDRAKGKYIARMDADDISLPSRFEEQVAYMADHPEVGICGTWYENFGSLSGVVKSPCLKEEVEISLFYGTPVGHPTVMMRRSMLEQYGLQYDQDFLYAEDYELFERAAVFFSIINLPKVLLQYRKHATQVTNLKWQHQYFLAGKIQARHFLRALGHVKPEDINWMENFFTGSSMINEVWFNQLDLYKKRILEENTIYTPTVLKKAVDSIFDDQKNKNKYNYFFKKYYAQNDYNLPLLRLFLKEKYKPARYLGKKLTLFFAVKCLLGYRKKSIVSQ